MPGSKRYAAMLMLGGMLCLGSLMIAVGTIEDAPELPAASYADNQSLTAGERTYLSFMVPRLDRLVDEVSAVSSLVSKHSRNIIALRGHGSRITALTREIIEWDDDNTVPADFLARHRSLIATTERLQELIDDAQNAFLRLDFESITDMIPRFDSTAVAVQTARDTFPPAGDSSQWRKLEGRVASKCGLAGGHTDQCHADHH